MTRGSSITERKRISPPRGGIESLWQSSPKDVQFFLIGHGLIEQGVRVRYFNTTALVQHLQQARAQLRLEEALHKLDRYRVLILDEFGYVKKSEQETHALFELIAHRYETASLIITSNQAFAEWDRSSRTR